MRPVAATDGVQWSVCLSVGHVHELCKNGWTDRDAVWKADSHGHKEPCVIWGSYPPRKRSILGVVWSVQKHYQSVLHTLQKKIL